MGIVISVLSGKGGTGKTTVCAGLAVALAVLEKSVLCVDMDMGLRNLDIALGMPEEPVLPFTEVSQGTALLMDATSHPRIPGLRLLTAPMSHGEMDLAAFQNMLLAAREQFDYVLLDAPAGVGDGFRMAAEISSMQLLVTGPDPAAVRDGIRVGELLELMGKENVRLIVNRVDPKLYALLGITIDDIMDTVGYGLLGLVPEDINVLLAAVEELALREYTRKGAAAAFTRIAKRLMGQKVPLKNLNKLK